MFDQASSVWVDGREVWNGRRPRPMPLGMCRYDWSTKFESAGTTVPRQCSVRTWASRRFLPEQTTNQTSRQTQGTAPLRTGAGIHRTGADARSCTEVCTKLGRIRGSHVLTEEQAGRLANADLNGGRRLNIVECIPSRTAPTRARHGNTSQQGEYRL